jgi:hypothetical protein
MDGPSATGYSGGGEIAAAWVTIGADLSALRAAEQEARAIADRIGQMNSTVGFGGSATGTVLGGAVASAGTGPSYGTVSHGFAGGSISSGAIGGVGRIDIDTSGATQNVQKLSAEVRSLLSEIELLSNARDKFTSRGATVPSYLDEQLAISQQRLQSTGYNPAFGHESSDPIPRHRAHESYAYAGDPGEMYAAVSSMGLAAPTGGVAFARRPFHGKVDPAAMYGEVPFRSMGLAELANDFSAEEADAEGAEPEPKTSVGGKKPTPWWKYSGTGISHPRNWTPYGILRGSGELAALYFAAEGIGSVAQNVNAEANMQAHSEVQDAEVQHLGSGLGLANTRATAQMAEELRNIDYQLQRNKRYEGIPLVGGLLKAFNFQTPQLEQERKDVVQESEFAAQQKQQQYSVRQSLAILQGDPVEAARIEGEQELNKAREELTSAMNRRAALEGEVAQRIKEEEAGGKTQGLSSFEGGAAMRTAAGTARVKAEREREQQNRDAIDRANAGTLQSKKDVEAKVEHAERAEQAYRIGIQAEQDSANDRLANHPLTARARSEVAAAQEAVLKADPAHRGAIKAAEEAKLRADEHEMVGFRSGAMSGSMTIDEALMATGFGMDLGGKAADRRAAQKLFQNPNLGNPVFTPQVGPDAVHGPIHGGDVMPHGHATAVTHPGAKGSWSYGHQLQVERNMAHRELAASFHDGRPAEITKMSQTDRNIASMRTSTTAGRSIQEKWVDSHGQVHSYSADHPNPWHPMAASIPRGSPTVSASYSPHAYRHPEDPEREHHPAGWRPKNWGEAAIDSMTHSATYSGKEGWVDSHGARQHYSAAHPDPYGRAMGGHAPDVDTYKTTNDAAAALKDAAEILKRALTGLSLFTAG